MEGDPQPTAAAPPAEAAPPASSDTAALTQTPVEAPPDFAAAFEAHAEAERGREPAAVDPKPADAPKPEGESAPAAGPQRDDKGRFLPKGEQPAPDATATAPSEPAKPAEAPLTREQIIAEYEAEKQAQSDREKADADAEQARDAVKEKFLGKPGELAALLQKLSDHRNPNSDVVFTAADEDRMVELTNGAQLYAPLKAQARAEIMAELGQTTDARVAEARAETASHVKTWMTQLVGGKDANGKDVKGVAQLQLDGFDAASAVKTINNLPGLVEAAYRARDGEVEDLKAQLAEARGQAFRSQPGLVTANGTSPGSSQGPGLGPNASPSESMAHAFETAARGARNGRRYP